MKALILGCGRIGALADWSSNEEIRSYAKALNRLNVDTDFFDISKKAAKACSERYGGLFFTNTKDIQIKKYDLCIISTPSKHHEIYLLYLMRENIKTIICEKPISLTLESLDKLEEAYAQSNSSVLVNYRRRFSSKALQIRDTIKKLLEKETITDIVITYQKGVLNNCSHAFDFLNYLLETNITFDKWHTTRTIHDIFEDDPTISFNLEFEGMHINAIGLVSAMHSYLSIKIYFKHGVIDFSECGDKLTVYTTEKRSNELSAHSYYPEARKTVEIEGLLENCMTNIIQIALDTRKNGDLKDNFKESLLLGRGMINSLLNN